MFLVARNFLIQELWQINSSNIIIITADINSENTDLLQDSDIIMFFFKNSDRGMLLIDCGS